MENWKPIREFFERHLKDSHVSVRLATCFHEAVHLHKRFPESSCLDKPVKDISFEDLCKWKGIGKETWKEFVSLRATDD